MGFSFKIATIAGIPIRLHFLFVIFLLIWVLPATCNGTAEATQDSLLLLTGLFGSVLLHELGHALVARQFGAQIVDIMLWPLGGFTRMHQMPDKPLPEFLVSVAGPAVNFILLAIAFAMSAYINVPGYGYFPYSPEDGGHATSAIDRFAWINAILGVSNLLPIFPMDGGRALRAVFCTKLGFLKATEAAIRVSRWLIVAGVVASIWYGVFIGPAILLGLFLWWQGAQELVAVRTRYGISPLHAILQKMFGMKIDPSAMNTNQQNSPRGKVIDTEPIREQPQKDAKTVNEDIESFRGSLDEYFRNKKDDRSR
ncbi:MAG: site-2 protease family protein [Planctomycetota bacterium]